MSITHRPSRHHSHIRGVQLPPEALTEPIPVDWGNYERGFLARQNPEVPGDYTTHAPDMYVNDAGALIAGPGIEVVEAMAHTPKALLLHANLDGTNELLLVAPPYLGIRDETGIQWYNYALMDSLHPWSMANYAGLLLMTNGHDAVHLREPYSTLLSATVAPIGRTLFTFAGRIFVGNVYYGGNREPLGLAWNAANGDPNDWSSIGSGFEALIDDMTTGDEIICGRPIGFDLVAILCRHSLWVGRRTGLRDRPVDISPRVPGLGTIGEPSVAVVRGGVMFASDNGVYMFDGNRETHVSLAIDAALYPLDRDNLDKYVASYDWVRDHYCLHTPRGDAFIYEIHHDRWFYRSHAFDTIVTGHDFVPPTRWSTIGVATTWADMGLETWEDLMGASGDYYMYGTQGANLVRNIYPLSDITYEPQWLFAKKPVEGRLSTILEYHGLEIEYKAPNGGSLRVYTPDQQGALIAHAADVTLPVAIDTHTFRIDFFTSGLGASCQIGYPVEKDIQISHARLMVRPASMRMTL